jgi:outer membrane receptor protein involved in Fe transport
MISFRKLSFYFGLVFFLVVGVASGQDVGILRGTVKDPSGALMSAASITMKAAVSEKTLKTQTDPNGAFLLKNIPLGQYTLQVEHTGFAPLIRIVQILSGNTPDVELAMALSAATTSVEVRAGRAELLDTLSPGTVSVVYPDNTKGEFKSLPDLLDEVPGVYVRRVSGTGQYTTTSVRGSSPTQVNIYVDGVPFNLASEAAADLSTIPVNDVERVEVYRGTVPARFSGAPIGGAINIVTKRPKTFSAEGSAGARTFGGRQFSLSVNGPAEKGKLLGGGKFLLSADEERSLGDFKYKNYYVQSFQNLVYPNEGPYAGLSFCQALLEQSQDLYDVSVCPLPVDRKRMNNSFSKDNVLAKWQNDKFSAKVSYLYMNRLMPYSVGISLNVDLPTDTNLNRRHEQELKQTEAVLGWNQSFGKLTVSALGNLMDQKKDYTNLGVNYSYNTSIGSVYSHYHTRRYASEVDGTYQLGDHWPVNQHLEFHGDWSQETLYSRMSPAGDLPYVYRRYKTNFQLQDTLTVSFLHNLEITPVGRIERMTGPSVGQIAIAMDADPNGNYGWKPNGGVALKERFAHGWQAYASYGKYIVYPNFYEIYGDGITVSPQLNGFGLFSPLQAEVGRNIDAGVGWDGGLTNNLSGHGRLTYFRRYTNNNITLETTPVGSAYHNTGDTINHGVEFEGSLHYGNLAGLQTAFTVQDGWYRNKGMYVWGQTNPMTPAPGYSIPTLRTPYVTGDARLDLHFFKNSLTTFFETKYIGQNLTDFSPTSPGADSQGNEILLYEGLDGYERALTTLDLGAHWKLPRGGERWKILGNGTLSAGVTDLFNQGPKQTKGGAGSVGATYSWSTCSVVEPAGTTCPPYDLIKYTATSPLKYNVPYPQQGRTVYAILAWEIKGWHHRRGGTLDGK